MENAGAGFTDAQIEVTLDPLDVDGGANPLAFVARKHDGGTWTRPASNTDGAQFFVTGLTSFSEFAIGEAAIHTITASAGANGTIAPAARCPSPTATRRASSSRPTRAMSWPTSRSTPRRSAR